MVEERQWSTNEYNLRIMRDIEELKSQIQNMRIERKESNKRISHLETENKYMRHMLTSLLNARSSDKLGDTNGPRERKPFPNTQRRGSQTLYNLQKQQQQLHASLDEQDETGWAHMVDTTPSTTSTIDIAATAENGKTPQKTEGHNNNNNNNNSVSSSDSERINGTSPPGFSLITPTTIIEAPKRKKDIEKLEIEQHSNLRRELNAAVVARKEADKRIIALETLVKTLTVNNAQYVDGNGATNSSHMSNGVGEQTNTTTTTNNSLLLSGGGGGQANVMAKYNKLQQQHHNIVGTHKLFASSQSQNQQQQQPHQSSASSSLNLSSPSAKLSLAGPITDL